jgi:glycosyltransferase involved in cell wall biosynthesis
VTGATRAGATMTSAHSPGRNHCGRVIALIPAHNEADWIERVVANLLTQTCPPDRVVVISDNSNDSTARLARQAGAEAWESGGNRDKKAGALNQALARLLPSLDDDDFVFFQDADTLPAPRWLEVARRWTDKHPGAVISGRYASPPTGKSLLRIIQENEFARDGRIIDRRGNRTRIVVGTSALFPVATLRAVISARENGTLPGPRSSDVYSTASITEDYELTLALKTLGFGTYPVAARRVHRPAYLRPDPGNGLVLRRAGDVVLRDADRAAHRGADRPGHRDHGPLQPVAGVDRHASALPGAPDPDGTANRCERHAAGRRADPGDRL